LASALSSMRIICPNRVSRHDWIIAVSLGCFVSLRTSSFHTNWYHLMPSSICRHNGIAGSNVPLNYNYNSTIWVLLEMILRVTWPNHQHRSIFLISGMQLSRLHSAIHRHHPPQGVVLSQICCFREHKLVMSQHHSTEGKWLVNQVKGQSHRIQLSKR